MRDWIEPAIRSLSLLPASEATDAVQQRALELFRGEEDDQRILTLDDLYCINLRSFESDYSSLSPYVRIHTATGLTPNSLPVRNTFPRDRDDRDIFGSGIYFIRAKSNPSLCGVVAQFVDGVQGPHRLWWVRKGSLAAWTLLLDRAARDKLTKNTLGCRPILSKEFLDDIVLNSIGFLRSSRRIKRFNLRTTRGLLLTGQPGNGKTMTCRYIKTLAAHYNFDTESIGSAELTNAFQNGKLHRLFSAADICFFDDVDISILSRGDSGHAKMACALLSAMDGVEQHGRVCWIFTTNEDVTILDPAFTRPGRIDCIKSFDNPTADLRREFISSWPAEIIDHIDVNKLVETTDGWSFADIDGIKSQLVINGEINQAGWNLDQAILQYVERRDSVPHLKRKKTPGFTA